jgi:hypothetical protein
MSLGIRVEGGGEFLKLQIEGRKLDERVRQSIRDLAKEGRREVVDALRSSKSGRAYGGRTGRSFYRRTRQTVTLFGGVQAKVSRNVAAKRVTKAYTASAPGEAPADLTGTLRRAIRTKAPRAEKGYGIKVFAYRGTAFYRHMLEFGTEHIDPRPLWGPIQDRMEAQLEGRILAAVRQFEESV